MTLLDAYAHVAFLAGGPAAAQVRSILKDGDTAIATMNLAETLDVSQRRYKLSIERAWRSSIRYWTGRSHRCRLIWRQLAEQQRFEPTITTVRRARYRLLMQCYWPLRLATIESQLPIRTFWLSLER